MMPEGLFYPTEITVPFPQEAVLRSLIRTRTHIYFAVTLLASAEEAAAFRAALGTAKVYLQEGAILWHLVLSVAELEEIQRDPGQRLRPGLHEAVRALAAVPTPPAQRIVPMEGQGTAFFISPGGDILTNYHIAREEIEPAGRTRGTRTRHPFKYLSFQTLEVTGSAPIGYRPLPDVFLLSNPSAADWQAGWDAALLQTSGSPPAYLALAPDLPRVGDEVWTYGFPMRSQRPPEQLRALGYRDADHSLRVSQGCITEWATDHTFVADLDGLAGNSGGLSLTATAVSWDWCGMSSHTTRRMPGRCGSPGAWFV